MSQHLPNVNPSLKETQVELEEQVIHGAHGTSAMADHLVMKKIIAVGVGSLLCFVVGGIWAWRHQINVQSAAAEQYGGVASDAAALADQYEVGIVNQKLFEWDTHANEKVGAQTLALKNGWGDEPNRAVHTPIDQAMDQVIQQAAGARGQQQQAPQPAPQQQPQPAPGR